MAILRKEQKRGYTCISNDVFNSDLSLKARGMLCTMLSLPNEWEFSENGLQAILKDGQTSIRSAIKELEDKGFLSRNRVRDENGRIGKCEWVISDYPRFENQSLDNSNLENRPQLTTKESNTNKSTTKKAIRHKHGEYQNVLLSDTDFAKLKSEFPNDWQERIERLSGYMASTGKSYKNHLATIRNWAKRDKDKPAYSKPKKPEYVPTDTAEWDF